jgi:hypothetical protein
LRRSLVALLVAAPLLAGCGDFVGVDDRDREQRELDRNWRRFVDTAPLSYSYVVRRNCECPYDILRPVEVWVDDGRVEHLIYVDNGLPVPFSYAGAFPSAEELFDIIQDAIDRRARDIDVDYDFTYGYPTSVYIDYDFGIGDEEFIIDTWGMRRW